MYACVHEYSYVCMYWHECIYTRKYIYVHMRVWMPCVCIVYIGVFVYKCVIWQLERLDAQSRSDLWGLLYVLLLSWPLLHQILVDRSNYINRLSGASEEVKHLNVTNCIIWISQTSWFTPLTSSFHRFPGATEKVPGPQQSNCHEMCHLNIKKYVSSQYHELLDLNFLRTMSIDVRVLLKVCPAADHLNVTNCIV